MIEFSVLHGALLVFLLGLWFFMRPRGQIRNGTCPHGIALIKASEDCRRCRAAEGKELDTVERDQNLYTFLEKANRDNFALVHKLIAMMADERAKMRDEMLMHQKDRDHEMHDSFRAEIERERYAHEQDMKRMRIDHERDRERNQADKQRMATLGFLKKSDTPPFSEHEEDLVLTIEGRKARDIYFSQDSLGELSISTKRREGIHLGPGQNFMPVAAVGQYKIRNRTGHSLSKVTQE